MEWRSGIILARALLRPPRGGRRGPTAPPAPTAQTRPLRHHQAAGFSTLLWAVVLLPPGPLLGADDDGHRLAPTERRAAERRAGQGPRACPNPHHNCVYDDDYDRYSHDYVYYDMSSGTRCSPSSCGKRTARALPDPYHWEKMTMGTTRTDRTGAGATPTYAPPAPTPTTTASATTTSTSTTTASTTTASTTTTTDSTSRRDRPRPIRSTSECLPDVLPPRYTLDAPLHEPSWRLTALTAAGPLRRPAASAWLAGWLAPRGGLAGWLAGSLAAVLHLAAGSPSDRPLEQARAEDIDTGPPTRSASTASGWAPGLTSLGPGHLDLHLHDSPRLHGGLGTATILRRTAPDPDDPRPPTPLLILTPPDSDGRGTAPMLRRTAPTLMTHGP